MWYMCPWSAGSSGAESFYFQKLPKFTENPKIRCLLFDWCLSVDCARIHCAHSSNERHPISNKHAATHTSLRCGFLISHAERCSRLYRPCTLSTNRRRKKISFENSATKRTVDSTTCGHKFCERMCGRVWFCMYLLFIQTAAETFWTLNGTSCSNYTHTNTRPQTKTQMMAPWTYTCAIINKIEDKVYGEKRTSNVWFWMLNVTEKKTPEKQHHIKWNGKKGSKHANKYDGRKKKCIDGNWKSTNVLSNHFQNTTSWNRSLEIQTSHLKTSNLVCFLTTQPYRGVDSYL